jgi:hypothetical protein
MKRAVILIVFLTLGILTTFWLCHSQRRREPEQPLLPLADVAFEYSYPFTYPGPPGVIAGLDSRCEAFLAEQETNWDCRMNETNGPYAGILRASGVTPSVQNLATVLASPPPNYDQQSASRTRLLSSLEELKSAFLGVATSPGDGSPVLHVSEDGHLALLWVLGPNNVYMFQDTSDGLRVARYRRKP